MPCWVWVVFWLPDRKGVIIVVEMLSPLLVSVQRICHEMDVAVKELVNLLCELTLFQGVRR